MRTDRVTSLAFRCMTAFAALFVVLGLGTIAWNLYFALGAEVRPGVFEYYHVARIATRTRDSSGRTRSGYSEESRPVYWYTDADGERVEVHASAAHVVAYLDRGDAIEVLVDPAGRHEPRIKGFVPLVADGLVMALVGGVFVLFAEVARGAVLRWFAARPLRGGGRGRGPAPATVAAPASPVQRRRGGTLRAVLVVVCLLSAAAGVTWWTASAPMVDLPPAEQLDGPAADGAGGDATGAPATATAPPASPGTPAAAGDAGQSEAAAPPARRGPSPVETAARRGEADALARLLAAGGDVAEVPLAAVKTLVAKEDLATLRVLFEHGFDLTQRYAMQTFGDQAVSRRSRDVVRLVREFDGLFEAPPEFVALVAGDVEALAAALREAPAERQWRGVRIDFFARHPEAKALLEQARSR